MSISDPLPPLDFAKIAAQRDAAATGNKRNTATADQTNGGAVILGWLLIITVLAGISRTRAGYVIIYYVLWLGVLLLVLGSYDRIVPLVALVQAPGPAGESGSEPGTSPHE